MRVFAQVAVIRKSGKRYRWELRLAETDRVVAKGWAADRLLAFHAANRHHQEAAALVGDRYDLASFTINA